MLDGLNTNAYTLRMQHTQLKRHAPIDVLYQDHHLLLVNKPAGIVMHPTYKHTDGDTFWDALLAYALEQGRDGWQPPSLPDEPEWALAPPPVREMLRERRLARLWQEDGLLPRPCLLHRLDKDTSGVVALARTERSRRYLVRQFHEHTIEKRYVAVVQKGAPEWTRPRTLFQVKERREGGSEVVLESIPDLATLGSRELILDGPLQRDPDERRRCIVGPEGQQAITALHMLVTDGTYTLLEVQPVTGRTHQIRAHLAAAGYAIVGDSTYALPAQNGTPSALLQRQFLHAYSLKLRRYPDDARCLCVAPLPDDLLSWLEQYVPAGSGAFNASTVISI